MPELCVCCAGHEIVAAQVRPSLYFCGTDSSSRVLWPIQTYQYSILIRSFLSFFPHSSQRRWLMCRHGRLLQLPLRLPLQIAAVEYSYPFYFFICISLYFFLGPGMKLTATELQDRPVFKNLNLWAQLQSLGDEAYQLHPAKYQGQLFTSKRRPSALTLTKSVGTRDPMPESLQGCREKASSMLPIRRIGGSS